MEESKEQGATANFRFEQSDSGNLEKIIQLLVLLWDEENFWAPTDAYLFLHSAENQKKYGFQCLVDYPTFFQEFYKPALERRNKIALADLLSQKEYYASLLTRLVRKDINMMDEAIKMADPELYEQGSKGVMERLNKMLQIGSFFQTAQDEIRSINFTEALRSLLPKAKEFAHQSFIFQALERGEQRVVITMPPQHGKTTAVLAYIFSLLINKPGIRIAYISYSQTNTQNRLQPLIRAIENRHLQGEHWRQDYRELANGSVLFPTSVDGTLTGEHLDLVVIDDPHKNYLEAVSKAKRDSVYGFYSNVVITRGFEELRVIFIGTRWHKDDLIGRVLATERDDVKLYELRALAEEDDPLGRKVGEALCPHFMSAERLTYIRNLYPDMFESQYQCRPRSQQDTLFIGEPMFYDEPLPEGELIISIGVDLAYTQKETSDYTAVVVLGIEPEEQKYYVLEAYRWRAKIDETIRRIGGIVEKFKVPVNVESGGAQTAVVDLLRQAGLRVVPVVPKGDKVTRALFFANVWNAGRFFVRRTDAPYMQEYIAEVLNFTGKGDLHDDFIDATVIAMQTKASKIQFL